MNALERVRQIISDEGHSIEKVVSDSRVVSRGYVFLVEKDDKKYILAHPRDIDMAIAQIYMASETQRLSDYVQGVEIHESYIEAMRIAQGVFKCSYKVK